MWIAQLCWEDRNTGRVSGSAAVTEEQLTSVRSAGSMDDQLVAGLFHWTYISCLSESQYLRLYVKWTYWRMSTEAELIDPGPSGKILVNDRICVRRSCSVITSLRLVLGRPLVEQRRSVWRGKCHRVQSEHKLLESRGRLVYGGRARPASSREPAARYCFIAHFYSFVTRVSVWNLQSGARRRQQEEEDRGIL